MNAADKLYYRLHPARFFEDIGSGLKRGRVVPDPWQRRVMECRSKRILLLTSRQAGKTSVMAALALWQALLFDEQLVLLVSPTERQSKILFARVARFYQALGGAVDTTSARRLGFEFENGSAIEALPGSPNTIQGFSPHLVLIDEAGAVLDETITVLRPSLAVTGGTLVLASKPYQARGVFYQEWTEGEGWYRERVRADDPVECPRITPEFLEEERNHLLDWQFAREYLTEFTEEGGSIFGPSYLFDQNTVDAPALWDEHGNYQPMHDPDIIALEKKAQDLEQQLEMHRRAKGAHASAEDDVLATSYWEGWYKWRTA